MKRNDMMDVILDGPRVQVPVECLDRGIGVSRPVPPALVEPLTTGLELPDPFDLDLDDDEALACMSHSRPEPAEEAETDEPRWVCPSHWLAPKMRAQGPTIWLDPVPITVATPVTIWLPARSDNGRRPGN
ncbi:MAG TPA: hypothetical protein VLI67_07590 [Vicinamibacteria bacterium]|nr:hypothetical protein [Vicinamibacteria bacterium]